MILCGQAFPEDSASDLARYKVDGLQSAGRTLLGPGIPITSNSIVACKASKRIEDTTRPVITAVALLAQPSALICTLTGSA